jgi:hypothetical protein
VNQPIANPAKGALPIIVIVRRFPLAPTRLRRCTPILRIFDK